MSNRSLRYTKLMKSMGIPEEQEPVRSAPEPEDMTPDRIEALTGMEHPELQQNRQMNQLIDAKIQQLEQSEDPNDLESLNFWKQKKQKLNIN